MNYLWIPAGVVAGSLMLASCQTPKPTAGTRPAPAPNSAAAPTASPTWQSKAYSLYPDSVGQGAYHARALSATELTSNYQSLAHAFVSPQVAFKFSINGKDNELPVGQDNLFLAVPRAGGGALETQLSSLASDT